MEQFCQAYHWHYKDVLKLTYPQILMWNHASYYNGEKIERKLKTRKDEVEEPKEISFDEQLQTISSFANIRMM